VKLTSNQQKNRDPAKYHDALAALVAWIDEQPAPTTDLLALREFFYHMLLVAYAPRDTGAKPNARARGIARECKELHDRLKQAAPNALGWLSGELARGYRCFGLRTAQVRVLRAALAAALGNQPPERAFGLIAGRGARRIGGDIKLHDAALIAEWLHRSNGVSVKKAAQLVCGNSRIDLSEARVSEVLGVHSKRVKPVAAEIDISSLEAVASFVFDDTMCEDTVS
jgi:hypothetical protein